MERVSITKGDLPILLIAPHGVDDQNTAYLVDKMSSEIGCFAVINRGWKRCSKVDYINDEANCNDIRHLKEDVVKEEFLEPILRSVAYIQKNIDERVYIFNVHGCSNNVRNLANDDNLDMIIGYGEGKPSSYTCDLRIKDAFCYFLEKEEFGVYEGKKNGSYSGRSKFNLNQLFRLWHPNNSVHSMQIEIVKELRSDLGLLHLVGDGIISAMDKLLMFDDTTKIKKTSKFI